MQIFHVLTSQHTAAQVLGIGSSLGKGDCEGLWVQMQIAIPAVEGLCGVAQNGKLPTGDQIATVEEAATSSVPM